MISLVIFIVSLFIFILLRIPVFVCLGLSSTVLWFHTFNTLNPEVFLQRMFAGLQSFTLMAIPFFMLCGELMNMGGLSKRLVAFSQNAIGWIRGGLGFTVVLTCMFIAAILGSASACAAIVGMALIPEMLDRGYKHDFSSALVASAGAVGGIIPPSILFIIYGVIAQVSVTKLFIGGYIPGILIGVVFMIYTYIHARRNNYPAEKKPTSKEFFISLYRALPTLLLPVIIMGGILGGIFTPTEAGCVGVVYAFLLGATLYRDEFNWKDLPKIFLKAAQNTAMVFMIISTSALLSWILTLEQIPQVVSSIILNITENKYIFLIVLNLFLILMGMFLDAVSGLTILAPVFLPVAIALGIDPLFFGIMISINLSIGTITPPVGLNLYVTSSIAKIDIIKLCKAVLPFCYLLFGVLMLLCFVPELVTFLPYMLD